jgi:hypothetical protein
MRTRLALATVALAAVASPLAVSAMVVVRHPVYVAPRPVVVVASAPVYVAPAPVYYAPPPPPPASAPLPVDSTMWTLPPGCTQVSLQGQTYFQCGPNLLKPLQSEKGTYYAVVKPPP